MNIEQRSSRYRFYGFSVQELTASSNDQLRPNTMKFRVEIFQRGEWLWVQEPFGFTTRDCKPSYDSYREAADQCEAIRRSQPSFAKPNVRVVTTETDDD